MQFESLSEFINMGGHGLYVWLAYALGVSVFLVNVFSPAMKRKTLLRNLARRLRRENSNP